MDDRLAWLVVEPQPEVVSSGGSGDVLVVLHPELSLVVVGGGRSAAADAVSSLDQPAWPDLIAAAEALVPGGGWPLGPTRVAGGVRVHVVQARSAEVAPGLRWAAQPAPHSPAPLRAAVAGVLAQDAGREPVPVQRPAWMRRGWWQQTAAWVDQQLEATGYSRSGELEPVEHWATSAVARVPITGGRLWLKAVPAWFAREPAVLELLGTRVPGRIPQVVAVDRSAPQTRFLMRDCGQVPGDVDDQDRPALAQSLAALLADLQVATADLVPELMAVGCADRTPGTLAVELTRIVQDGVELDRLDPDERAALIRRLPELTETLLSLADLVLPPVLVHGDYHPWNVARRSGAPWSDAVIIDWTDASIGPAGTDLTALLHPTADGATRDRLRAAYAQAWVEQLALPAAPVAAAVAAATAAGHVIQASAFDQIQRAVEPQARWESTGAMTRHLRALATPTTS